MLFAFSTNWRKIQFVIKHMIFSTLQESLTKQCFIDILKKLVYYIKVGMHTQKTSVCDKRSYRQLIPGRRSNLLRTVPVRAFFVIP